MELLCQVGHRRAVRRGAKAGHRWATMSKAVHRNSKVKRFISEAKAKHGKVVNGGVVQRHRTAWSGKAWRGKVKAKSGDVWHGITIEDKGGILLSGYKDNG